VLLQNVFDYLDRVAQRDWTKHDVFAIDINLGQRVDAGRDLPVEFRGVEKSAFHRKGGFYIYNHLIRNGVPFENICFLTGEKESTLEFAEHCRTALMPQPTAFSKSDSGFAEFREWLRQRREDPYVTLRRGIIEGCEYLRSRVEADETVFQFGAFIAPKGGDVDRVSRDEILGYIDTLQAFLPPIGHTEGRSALEIKRIEQLYRLFVRTLAHEWDAANPGNLARDMPMKQKNILSALGWIMKNVRNWTAHTSVINRLEAQDVAFMFLINMRAMFDLGPKLVTYERVLLALFSNGDDRLVTQLVEEQLRDALVHSYRKVKERVFKAQQARDAVYFSEIVNNLVLAKEALPGVNFLVLLYHSMSTPIKQ
jgi:hypothetical protein